MKDWKRVLASPKSSILKVIDIIDQSALQVAVIVDEKRRLLGIVTDGNVRRAILRKISLESPVEKIMFREPMVGHVNDDRETLINRMRQKELRQMPILDDEGRVVGLETLLGLVKTEELENIVVLMAGGMGSRLSPLTQNCPKPLLKVGDKPILEIIIENLLCYGFKHFYLSVNYKADMVRSYFGDGSHWNVEIKYIFEDKPHGTAGSLSLMPEKPQFPFIVMNGDLLTKVNFRHLLNFHIEQQAKATMCVREYDFQVPYGVANIDGQRLVKIEEKPTHTFFVNAGIYVFDPEILEKIPNDVYYDMPQVFQEVISRGSKVSVFPIREYWLDVGRISDYEKANGEYRNNFKND